MSEFGELFMFPDPFGAILTDMEEPGGPNPNYLDWKKWKEEKPRAKRWVLFWWAKKKEFETFGDASPFRGNNTRFVDMPTLWAYIPSQREMVNKHEH